MGLMDILKKYDIEYDQLIDILYDVGDLVEFDINLIVDELDPIYIDDINN